MTLDKLNVPYEDKKVDVAAGENRKPEFLKMNPEHTIPVYKEGDLVLYESRAILTYLAAKHGDEKLYPKDLKKRAQVESKLYFDAGLFNKLANIVVS